MSLLSSPASAFHPFDMAAFAERLICGPAMFPAIGHRDEATAMLADPEAAIQAEPDELNLNSAEIAEGIEAWETDRCIQRADESHLADARQASRAIKALLGASCHVRVTRGLTLGTDNGTDGESYWQASADHAGRFASGSGATPNVAIDKLLAEIRSKFGIGDAFGGYVVAGRAMIVAGHERSRTDALGFAYRIALDVAYLDTLLEFGTPGVVDLRPPSSPATAPAALPAAVTALTTTMTAAAA